MNKKSNRKEKRQEQLLKYVAENPFLTDQELAEVLQVSVQTIRLDRSALKIPELRERLKHVARGDRKQVKSLSYGELVGELVEVTVGKDGNSILTINQDMVFKKNQLARGHYLFAQANSLAVALIDAPVALTGSARVCFRHPVTLGERVVARANIETQKGNKYKVIVKSQVKDISVFEGRFTVFAINEEEEK